MKRWLGSCVVGVSVIAATLATGQGTTAPLATTQQELRKLEGDNKVKTGTAPAVMPQLDLPTMQTVVETTPSPYQMAKSRELEKERKSRGESRKNWLVNGVEKLSQSATDENKNSPEDLGAESAGKHSQMDQEYLLNAFNEQRKSTDTKHADATKARVSQADPFAPFLKDWLGSSPTQSQFAVSSTRSTTEQSSLLTPSGFAGGSMGSAGENRTALQHAQESVNAQPNPYLSGASNNQVKGPATPTGMMSQDLNLTIVPKPAIEQRFTPRLDKSEPPPQTAPKQQFTAPADEKKYFPQLKKF